jgi:hypothetical protein
MDELFMKNLGVTEGPPAPAPQSATPAFLAPAAPSQSGQNPFMKQQQPQAPPQPPQGANNPFAPLSQQAPTQQMPQQQPAYGAQGYANEQQGYAGAPQQTQQAQATGGPGLFSIDDRMIDKIFSEEPPPPPPQQQQPPKFNVGKVNEAVREISQQAPPPMPPMQPMSGMPPPKIEGIGKLDTKAESTDNVGGGRIASIGKFLLDQKDLEKIGKLTGADLSESKMRILTTDAAQELQNLLHHIGTQKTVIGSVIVGHDGLLIANTMPNDLDAESIGVWALGIYMNTEC